MSNGYKYDAFISYRHAELDKFVAENLHRKLESYKVSKKVISNGRARRSRIERVFRDKDELPITNNLEDPIIQALQQSEYLLVICTPRLKESIWCKKEIETFISMHGRDKIFAVLAEGEPQESFPEEILYREGQVQYPDGTIGMGLIPAEPLAADVRGKSKKEILKAMDVEVLRLLAPMLGVEFDDLKQRHRERKFKKIITAAVATAVLCLGIGIASTITALHINKQKEKIEAQSVEIQAQADEIASQSDAIVAQNEQLLENQAKNLAEESLDYLASGDRKKAVETAVAALTEYEDMPMVYTPEARYALSESLYHYDNGTKMKPVFQMEMSSLIVGYTISPDGNLVACIDTTGEICIWDLSKQKKVMVIPERDGGSYNAGYTMAFVDNEHILCIRGFDQLCKIDIATGEEKASIVLEGMYNIYIDEHTKYAVVTLGRSINIYDVSSEQFQLVDTISATEGYSMDAYLLYLQDNKLLYSESKIEDIDFYEHDGEKDYTEFVKFAVYDFDTKNKLAEISEDYEMVTCAMVDGNYIYYGVGNLVDEKENVLKGYDMASGELLWENREVGFISSMYMPKVQDSKFLIEYGMGLYYIDKETGQLIDGIELAASAVYVEGVEETKDYLVLTNTGQFGKIVDNLNEYVIFKDHMVKNFSEIGSFDKTAKGYILEPVDDNKIVYYEYTVGKNALPYDGEYADNMGLLEQDNPEAVINEINSDKAGILNTIMYSDDKKLMFVSYNDEVLEIYDNTTNVLLNKLENISPSIFLYYGTDKEGNIYIADYDCGYILDSECNLIGRVELMSGIDAENEKIIIDVGDQRYMFPMYSVEEMIRMGKEIID